MRAFICIELPFEVRKKIVEIQRKLPEFKGKLTEEENLHLTLKFLGEIDDKKVEEVKKRLKEIKFRRFEAEINSIGLFSEDFIKIVWLHLSNCEKLQEEIDGKLKDIFEKEKRFMGHLTIARVKSCKRKEFIEQLKKIKIDKIKFLVDNFKLKKSTLTSNGPLYEDILEVKSD